MSNNIKNLKSALTASFASRPWFLQAATLAVTVAEDGKSLKAAVTLNGAKVASWRSAAMPGCSTMAITSKSKVERPFQGSGVGAYLRNLREAAYRAAGFKGEQTTIRHDNAGTLAIVNPLISSGKITKSAQIPSHKGGSYAVYVTRL